MTTLGQALKFALAARQVHIDWVGCRGVTFDDFLAARSQCEDESALAERANAQDAFRLWQGVDDVLRQVRSHLVSKHVPTVRIPTGGKFMGGISIQTSLLGRPKSANSYLELVGAGEAIAWPIGRFMLDSGSTAILAPFRVRLWAQRASEHALQMALNGVQRREAATFVRLHPAGPAPEIVTEGPVLHAIERPMGPQFSRHHLDGTCAMRIRGDDPWDESEYDFTEYLMASAALLL